MFICTDCGRVFEEPKKHIEYHPYGEGYAGEEFYFSPCCNSGYDEAEECEFCGEYHSAEDLYDGVCEHCKEGIKQRIAKAIYKEFSQGEFDALPDDVFEDIWEDVENLYRMGDVVE